MGTAPQGHDDVLSVDRVTRHADHPDIDVLDLILTEYVNPKQVRRTPLRAIRDHRTLHRLRFIGLQDRPIQGAVYELVRSERGDLTETSEWQMWDCISGCRSAPAHLDYQRTP